MSNNTSPTNQQKYFTTATIKIYLVVSGLLLLITSSYAQVQSHKPIHPADKYQNLSFVPNLQIGISAGPSIFFGDVKQNPIWPISENMNEWRFAYGANFNYNISPVLTIRLQGLYGKLSGTKRADEIWFENDYYELNINTAINFNNLFGEKRIDRLASVIGVLGFGILNYNTIVKRLGNYFVYKRVGYGYGTGINGRERQEYFMLGLGVDFRVNNRLNIALESVSRMPDTDMIDGVVTGKYYDTYNYTSIGLTYRFTYIKKKDKKQEQPESAAQTLTPALLIPTVVLPLSIETDISVEPEHSIYYPTFLIKLVNQFEQVELQEEYTETQQQEYRVQFRAEFAKPLVISWLSSMYNIPISEIKEDFTNGYYIYSVGSYPTYDEALIKCNELKTQNGLHDAFVVAFKDGERIYPLMK